MELIAYPLQSLHLHLIDSIKSGVAGAWDIPSR